MPKYARHQEGTQLARVIQYYMTAQSEKNEAKTCTVCMKLDVSNDMIDKIM